MVIAYALPVVGAAIIAVTLTWLSLGRRSKATWLRRAAGVVAQVGPGRIRAAIDLLGMLARRAPPPVIPEVWRVLELPLVQALPDCPPDQRAELRAVLEAVHMRTPVRDVQRSLMDMRNAVIGDSGYDSNDPRLG